MSTRILLTGATGFVGGQSLASLKKRGAHVTAVVRGDSRRLAGRCVDKVITTEDAFTQSHSWWASALQGIDTVIHAAWFAESGKYLWSRENLDCLKGTITLGQVCAEVGIRRFVGVGTCLEYDTSVGYLSVNTPLRPATPYAAAKAATYFALSHSLEQAGVEFSWCRLFYLYGEGEDPQRVVPYIHQQLQRGQFAELTNGLQVRDYLNVCDASASIVNVAYGSHTGAVNICSGVGITIRELALSIAEGYRRPDLLRFGARSNNIHDPQTIVGIKDLEPIERKVP